MTVRGRARWQPRRFYATQAIVLALSGALLLWLFHVAGLDLRLEVDYYDPASHAFPWRHRWLTESFIHRDLTLALVACGFGVWVMALVMKFRGTAPRLLRGHERRWWLVAWSFVVVPLLIDTLRYFSGMHCPWSVIGFGGTVPYFDLLSAAPQGAHPGRCFPAAAVTSGSWLLSLALLWYPERKSRSVALGAAALALALVIGWVQQMRGAHFLSHTLWSLWISWATIVLLHRVCGAGNEVARPPRRDGDTATPGRQKAARSA